MIAAHTRETPKRILGLRGEISTLDVLKSRDRETAHICGGTRRGGPRKWNEKRRTMHRPIELGFLERSYTLLLIVCPIPHPLCIYIQIYKYILYKYCTYTYIHICTCVWYDVCATRILAAAMNESERLKKKKKRAVGAARKISYT